MRHGKLSRQEAINIVNLTPHPVTIEKKDGTQMVIKPSGIIPRAKQTEKAMGEIDGVPVIKMSFGEVENMPAPKANTIFVVSAITAQALKGRYDVFVPARPIRDKQGRIIGCEALARV